MIGYLCNFNENINAPITIVQLVVFGISLESNGLGNFYQQVVSALGRTRAIILQHKIREKEQYIR